MSDKPLRKDETGENPGNVTLPPVDATPEDIAKALFGLKPEGKTETPA